MWSIGGTKLSLPYKVSWVSDFQTWLNDGAIYGNGSILTELLPSPLEKKITALCMDDYISSLSSSELLSLILYPELNPFVTDSQGSLGLPFDNHSTGKHCLKLPSPLDVNSRSLGAESQLFPELPTPKIQPTIISSPSLLN